MDSDQIDWQAIDIKSLAPDEWAALKQRVIRNSHALRGEVLSDLFGRLLRSALKMTRRYVKEDHRAAAACC